MQDLNECLYAKGKRYIVDTHLMPDSTSSTALAALDALRDTYGFLDFYCRDWATLMRLRRAITWLLSDHGSTWAAWTCVEGLFWQRKEAVREPWRLHAESSSAREPTDEYVRRWLLELPIEALVYLCGTLANYGLFVM